MPAECGREGQHVNHEPERELLWASQEGQVVNFWVYVLAGLTFWLVIPLIWAAYRYLRTSMHRYELTDQRLLEYSGIVVKRIESLELYRVVDIRVDGTVLQSLFGRGQVRLMTSDQSTPQVTLNAVAAPAEVASRVREAVERCRVAKGARAFDV
jgi:uncharacterized membrane protein YdbT with pleckstrin-like domain